jgi:hypothetical protein
MCETCLHLRQNVGKFAIRRTAGSVDCPGRSERGIPTVSIHIAQRARCDPHLGQQRPALIPVAARGLRLSIVVVDGPDARAGAAPVFARSLADNASQLRQRIVICRGGDLMMGMPCLVRLLAVDCCSNLTRNKNFLWRCKKFL